jgi:hypothetical protein
VKTLALVFLLARPAAAASQAPPVAASSAPAQAAALPAGTLERSKLRLEAHDPAGALADAEAAVAKTHGADEYAARGAAKLALGRPMDEAIADYEEASKLDPRYIEKYKGLIVQRDSERNPKSRMGGKVIETGVNAIALTLGAIMASGMIIVFAFALARGREKPFAPSEGGKPTPKKEPPEAS